MSSNAKKLLTGLLDSAGITINGSRPFDIQILDEQFYKRVMAGGSLAAGESFMDGEWEVVALDQFFDKILRAHLDQKFNNWKTYLAVLKARIFNQ